MSFLDNFRRRDVGASLGRILFFWISRTILVALIRVFYRNRHWGGENVPGQGPVLLICNHQSYIDLPVVSSGLYRHFHSMAKKQLFEHWLFKHWVRLMNAFPVDQDKGDRKSIKLAIEALEKQKLLLIFPEGTRTEDGTVGPFKEGMMLILRKCKPLILPAGLDGPFDAWPIGGKPKPYGRTGIVYGKPIPAEQVLAMGTKEGLDFLRKTVDELRLEARAKLRQASGGKYPLPGPADEPVDLTRQDTAPRPAEDFVPAARPSDAPAPSKAYPS